MSNSKQFKISARNAWDTVEIGPFNTYEEAVQSCKESKWDVTLIKEVYALLREVVVYYKNGGRDNAPFCMSVNMAAHLSDKDIFNYYKEGKSFNIGVHGFDLMAEVERVEILQ